MIALIFLPIIILLIVEVVRLRKKLTKSRQTVSQLNRGAVEPIITELASRGQSLVLLRIDQDAVILRRPQ